MSSKASRRRARRTKAVEKVTRYEAQGDVYRAAVAPGDPSKAGVTGGGLAALDTMAIARGWVSAATPERMAAVLTRQVAIAINPSMEPRDASRAAAVVVKAVGQVMEQEKREAGGDDSKVQVNVAVAVNAGESVREIIQHDPQYAIFLEQQQLGQCDQLEAISHPAPVGQNGFAGGVHGAASSAAVEPGRNGHHHGNGWHPSSNGDATSPAR